VTATTTAERPAAPVSDDLPAHVPVLVVGSGFAGLCAAIKLGEAGRSYLVIERGDEVGGTWHDNSYPGCACDVPSHLYSFSFDQRSDWAHTFSRQPQIYAYLRSVADRYGLRGNVRLSTELLDARWDAGRSRWDVTTSRGSLTADVLVLGTGALSDAAIPDIPGLADFGGTVFHSAGWRHDHDLTGERVAVIGTGASAIQFVPYVQRDAGHLTLFQRTPPWVLPRKDRPYGEREKLVKRLLPAYSRAIRAGIYVGRESWVLGFVVQPAIMRLAERMARHHIAEQIDDPQLRAQLTPRYRLGCKRVLLSSDYYPALNQPNADVVTDPIVRVSADAVVTAGPDGAETEHPADTIIFGTGFRVNDLPVTHRVRDAEGRTLAEHWSDGMSALHGSTIAGFPNLVMLMGPNTGLGHTSVVLIIEAQVRYLLELLAITDARGAASFEPDPQALQRWNDEVQDRLRGTVWNAGGCASWYLGKDGRNSVLWPSFTFDFFRRLRGLRAADYRFAGRARSEGRVAA
jgi:cation diffusion facilitator CzcD-associated flavoprotein CzcO